MFLYIFKNKHTFMRWFQCCIKMKDQQCIEEQNQQWHLKMFSLYYCNLFIRFIDGEHYLEFLWVQAEKISLCTDTSMHFLIRCILDAM